MQRKSSTRWVLTFCVLLLVLGSGYTQDQGQAYPNEQRNAKNVLTELLEASITVSKALLSWKSRIAKFTRSFLTMGHEVEEEPEEQDMPTVYYTKKPLVIDQNTVTNVRH